MPPPAFPHAPPASPPLPVVALFVALTLGGGLAIGYTTRPDAWYAALQKPTFNPPNWIFAPVWSLLYVLIGVGGARIFTRARSSPAMKTWFVQLALNFAWSPVFFAAQRPGAALVVIVALLASLVLFVVQAWPRDRIAALLCAPYLAWVGYAVMLNWAIWRLNG